MENLFLHTFSQRIWRILPHSAPDRNEWIVELRDGNERKTSFALIDLAIPALKWQLVPNGADWWTTLAGFSGNRVFLHNYRNPELPDPSDLLALSVATGELEWVLPNHYLVSAGQGSRIGVAKKAAEGVTIHLVDSQTGGLISPSSEKKIKEEGGDSSKFPVRYVPDDRYFEAIASFVSTVAGVNGALAFDYIESDPFVVLSYYIYEPEELAQYLLIVNRKKEIVYHERLAERLKGIGRDTILMKGDILVFLKNSNEFISLKLIP